MDWPGKQVRVVLTLQVTDDALRTNREISREMQEPEETSFRCTFEGTISKAYPHLAELGIAVKDITVDTLPE